MTLRGDVVNAAGVQFQRISQDTFKRLKFSRQVSNKSDRAFAFQASKGVTTVRGVAPIKGDRPPALSVQFQLNRAVLEKLYKQALTDHGRIREAVGELSIEQILNGITFYKSMLKIRINIVSCKAPNVKEFFDDKIQLKNMTNGADVLVTWPGRDTPTSCADYNAKKHRSNVSTLEVGNMLKDNGCNSEVATFARDHRVEVVRPSSWTDRSGDLVTVDLNGLLPIPIIAWVLYDPNGNARDEVVNGVIEANTDYGNAFCGVQFADPIVEIKVPPPGSTDFPDVRTAVEQAKAWGFHDSKKVNLYIVKEVGTAIAEASWPNSGVPNDNFGNEVVINLNIIQTKTIAHELGHVLALNHSPDSFDNNLMQRLASNVGPTITKGQCYRTNVDGGSYVNTDNVRTNATGAVPVKLNYCPRDNAVPGSGGTDWCPILDFNP
ncbi:putative etalloprotease [Nitrospira moscoviensis]|uniref:Putative etalloprotease n=2 Tax=Nitrospira moscoviensis TaxID=42253 RepID=A0A0K2GFA9_NITMO|nr:putative etalloprotease [Nitrospira moscoviensis]